MTSTMKRSRQREAIVSFLQTRKDHPTADIVYSNMREEFPNISLGTVYRNLSLLVEIGEAIKVPCDDGSEHFDGCTDPHFHFQCTACNAVLDLDIEDTAPFNQINKTANKNFSGVIEGSRMFFYGKCVDCIKGNKKAL